MLKLLCSPEWTRLDFFSSNMFECFRVVPFCHRSRFIRIIMKFKIEMFFSSSSRFIIISSILFLQMISLGFFFLIFYQMVGWRSVGRYFVVWVEFAGRFIEIGWNIWWRCKWRNNRQQFRFSDKTRTIRDYRCWNACNGQGSTEKGQP